MSDTAEDRKNTSPAADTRSDENDIKLAEQIKDAIVNGNAAAVEGILTANPDVLKAVFSYTLPGNETVTAGLTPLMLAAALGKDTVAEFILEKGSDYFADTDQKLRAFFLAVSRDHAEVAKVMLEGERGLDLLELRNEQDETPLLVAARNGADVMVGVLLKYRADFRAQNSDGDTAIHVASRTGYFHVVKMMFHDRGSDILELEDNDMQTPLLAAAANGKTDIFQFLLDKGAYDGALDQDGNAAIHLASKYGHSQVVEIIFKARGTKCLELRGDYERTPLLAAAANGKAEVVKFLLDKGADISAQDLGTYDAIHRASQFGHLAVIEKLYEAAGTKILEVKGKFQQTPLLTAADNGKIEIVQYLLDKGASIMARDFDRNSALHFASGAKSIGIVKLILEREPDLLDLRNVFKETALLIAARQLSFEILKYLHSKGADITAQDIFGRTAMLNATAKSDDPSIVKYLLDAGEDPTRTTYYGNNALHIACAHKRAQIVDILLDGAANFLKTAIASENENRDTPLCIAILSNEESIILRLLQSTVYYPVSPAQDDVYIACLREIDRVYKWLLNWVEHFPNRHEHDQHGIGDVRDSKQNERGQETSNDKDPNSHNIKYLNTVIYWALLNDKGDLIELAMKKSKNPAPNQEGGRKGITWLHVAALGGHVNLLEKVPNWRDSIKAEATKKITPLHLAAKQGNYDMVWKLLECLESENMDNSESPTTGPQRVLRAIVQGTEDAESLISLATARKDSREHMRLERSLWDKLFEIIEGDWNFFEVPHTDDAELVMGVAAWCHTTGEKEYFYKLMSIVDGTKWRDFKLFPLQLTVQHQFPLALWWLLSSGRNFGEKPIREGEAMMRYWTRPKSDKERFVHGLIEELLANPPPVRPPLKDDKRPPHFQYERPEGDLQKGAVLDLFVTNKRDIIIEFKRSSMVDIIYDKGPNEIMRNDGYRDFKAFKKRLFSQSDDLNKQQFESEEPALNSQLPAEESPHIGSKKSEGESKKQSGKGDTSELGSRERRSRFRWIHIPVNNLRYVEVPSLSAVKIPITNSIQELMVRISIEKKRVNDHHRHLADFVKKSWSELPAGGGNHYMKPHCQSQTIAYDASTGSDTVMLKTNPSMKSTKMVALYMPYISWGYGLTEKDFEYREVKTFLDLIPVEDPIHETASNTALTNGTDGRVEQALKLGEKRDTNNKQSSNQKNNKQNITKAHGSITLDQYYYVSLQDTGSRDCDQVLVRYFDRRREANDKARAEMERNTKIEEQQRKKRKGGENSVQIQGSRLDTQGEVSSKVDFIGYVRPTKILMVNQLWLWILDNGTIITSTTEEPDDVTNTFLQRVLTNLQDRNGSAVSSIEDVAEYIIATATSLFNSQNIEIEDSEGSKKSPLEIFRESIQHVRDEETRLFREFRDSLVSAKQGKLSIKNKSQTHVRSKADTEKDDQSVTKSQKKRPALASVFNGKRGTQDYLSNLDDSDTDELPNNGPKKWWSQLALENPYEDILMETRLLHEVKDILDELNILKNLAQDQKVVDDLWKSISGIQGYRHLTPAETKDDIEGMIEDAKSVQSAINTLLDLKQKEATILEAQATRRQSDAVMVFTVVTIIFLPASFLTSMFALNVADFPHEDGNLMYRGRWIFPIIFGVSVPVSIIFMVIAFNANRIKSMWKSGTENINQKLQAWREGTRAKQVIAPGNDGIV